MSMSDHLPPTDHDGTAIDWDSECLRTPADPFLDDLAWIAAGLFGWISLVLAVIGLCFGWWLP